MASLDDITCTGRRRRRRGGPVKNPLPGLDGHRVGLASGPEGRRPVRWGSTTPGSPHAGSCLRPWREAALPAHGAGTRVRESECTSHTVRAAGHFHVTGGHGCPSAAAVRQGHPSPRSPEPPREIPRNPKKPQGSRERPGSPLPKNPQGSPRIPGDDRVTPAPARVQFGSPPPLPFSFPLPSSLPPFSLPVRTPARFPRRLHRTCGCSLEGHAPCGQGHPEAVFWSGAARVTPPLFPHHRRPGRVTPPRDPPARPTLARPGPGALAAVAPPGSPPRTSVTGSGRPRHGPRGFSRGPQRV